MTLLIPDPGNATWNLTVPMVGSTGVGFDVAGVAPLEQPIAAADCRENTDALHRDSSFVRASSLHLR